MTYHLGSALAASPDGASEVCAHPGMPGANLFNTLRMDWPVELVLVGQPVVTRNGAEPVVQVETRLVPSTDVVRISAGALGENLPASDVLLAPGQRVLLTGRAAKRVLGLEAGIIEAGGLVNGDTIKVEVLRGAELYLLRFSEPTFAYVAGLPVECPGMNV